MSRGRVPSRPSCFCKRVEQGRGGDGFGGSKGRLRSCGAAWATGVFVVVRGSPCYSAWLRAGLCMTKVISCLFLLLLSRHSGYSWGAADRGTFIDSCCHHIAMLPLRFMWSGKSVIDGLAASRSVIVAPLLRKCHMTRSPAYHWVTSVQLFRRSLCHRPSASTPSSHVMLDQQHSSRPHDNTVATQGSNGNRRTSKSRESARKTFHLYTAGVQGCRARHHIAHLPTQERTSASTSATHALNGGATDAQSDDHRYNRSQ